MAASGLGARWIASRAAPGVHAGPAPGPGRRLVRTARPPEAGSGRSGAVRQRGEPLGYRAPVELVDERADPPFRRDVRAKAEREQEADLVEQRGVGRIGRHHREVAAVEGERRDPVPLGHLGREDAPRPGVGARERALRRRGQPGDPGEQLGEPRPGTSRARAARCRALRRPAPAARDPSASARVTMPSATSRASRGSLTPPSRRPVPHHPGAGEEVVRAPSRSG